MRFWKKPRRRRRFPVSVQGRLSSWPGIEPAIHWFATPVSLGDLPPYVRDEVGDQRIWKAFWNHTPDRWWIVVLDQPR